MAEVYTVTLSNQSPQEITGGRVGTFVIVSQPSWTQFYYGGENFEIDYGDSTSDPALAVHYGVNLSGSGGPVILYVTSPDEINAQWFNYNGGSPTTAPLTIFHCR